MSEKFDTQGHRGCRGLLPENTIPAFAKALELGVVTLEMDLAVSGDLQIIVSHDPYYNHHISTHPDGIEITEENQESFNIYKMSYDSIKTFDVGLKNFPRFPDQEKIAVHKPLFIDVVKMAEEKSRQYNRPLPMYNVEIKSKPAWDAIFYPSVQDFVDLTVAILEDTGIKSRTSIQSFDIRALQITHEKYPEIKTVYLVEREIDYMKNIDLLGFIPDIYSPNYKLVNKELVNYCSDKNMLLIPWTVNRREEMRELIKQGVDGIISDYPNVLIEVVKVLQENAGN